MDVDAGMSTVPKEGSGIPATGGAANTRRSKLLVGLIAFCLLLALVVLWIIKGVV